MELRKVLAEQRGARQCGQAVPSAGKGSFVPEESRRLASPAHPGRSETLSPEYIS